MWPGIFSRALIGWNFLSSLNAVISTNERNWNRSHGSKSFQWRFWECAFFECPLFAIFPYQNVLFLEYAFFWNMPFWNMPFLECALFWISPFLSLPFWNCFLWNVLLLECALLGMFPFQGWRTLCFKEHFTQKEHFALLHLAQKNSLLQIGLLQFAL